ncbi:Panacea domain-containing protein, partial [Listeria monocytogenes]|uniref:Panacea domain-containing protein n=1 Tax=Listeria monocytogenes TaxID=1639 RepID=UPI002FDC0622
GEPYRADLNDSERAVIQHVWKRYGQYSVRELSDLTHQVGTPWSNAYFGRGRNANILNDDVQQHFTELALAGRK